MPPPQNPIDASEDIVETVNLETLSFPIFLADDASNLNSDDGAGTNKKRAFERFPTYPQAPIVGRKRAISVMTINVDDHRKKR